VYCPYVGVGLKEQHVPSTILALFFPLCPLVNGVQFQQRLQHAMPAIGVMLQQTLQSQAVAIHGRPAGRCSCRNAGR
jgi:hypothetical protein